MIDRFSMLIRDRHGFERTVPLSRNIVVGRHSTCDIVLSDNMVSRNHLKIELVNGHWWVEDAGSSHGSFLKDERVTRAPWTPGSTIRLADGAYFITLRNEASAASEVNLHAILQTAQLLTCETELEDLLEQTMDRLLAISGTDRGFIMLPEAEGLVVKVNRNLDQDLQNVERIIHVSMSAVHRVFDAGETIWIHNVANDERLMAQQSVVDLQLKTILCLPLAVQGRRIGVVYLDSRKIVTEPVDRPTFEAIVALCAIAIERTRLSEESLRNQVLATVGQVSSSIVHDFKNVLFVVRGHAEMLGGARPEPEVQYHTNKIIAAVDRLTNLTMDVLDYAKVREPQRQTVDLHTYLSASVEALQPRAGDMGITLRAEGPPLVAALDTHRFSRVVENLLANSLDALADVPEGAVSLRWGGAPGGLQIIVEDNGKGIPRKVLRRIFEPFFSHGKPRGTGLGMATVKKIVEEHGGTIQVHSEEGAGTRVTIFLPDMTSPKVQSETSTGAFQVLDPEA